MATLVAVRFRPEWQARYQRLLDRGRAKKEASPSSRANCSPSSTICCVPVPPTILPPSTRWRRRHRVDIRYELFQHDVPTAVVPHVRSPIWAVYLLVQSLASYVESKQRTI